MPLRQRFATLDDVMAHDFFNLSYLAEGSPIQQKALLAINKSMIMEILAEYNPVLAGTLPLNLFVEGSDLDILCCCNDFQQLTANLVEHFAIQPGFKCEEKKIRNTATLIVRFYFHEFQFEIFSQPVLTKNQVAYLHLVREFAILERYPHLHRKILELKQGGMKTEPAFAKVLSLTGDPYRAILDFSL